MKDLIKEIQKSWMAAKAKAQKECEQNADFELAEKLAVCSMFTGEENLEKLISLMFSTQGIEFLTTFGFPDLPSFRRFIIYHPERFGVFIDSGKIALNGVKSIFMVGNTEASIKCDEAALYRIILMHGATAKIEASGYAVVKVEKDNLSDYDIVKTEFAKIL